MNFNSLCSPMLQSVFTKLPDVLPANFFLGGGGGGDSNSCDDLG